MDAADGHGILDGEDGPKAPDAREAQRWLTQVRPRIDARSPDEWTDSISEASNHGYFNLMGTDVRVSRPCPRPLMASQLTHATAKTLATLGDACVAAGADAAKTAANVRSQGASAQTLSRSTSTSLAQRTTT